MSIESIQQRPMPTRCQECYNLEPYCTCHVREPSQQPAPSNDAGFDEAVRKMARRKGYEVPDDAKVWVEMTGCWSGYSDYSLTNQWDEFTVSIEGGPSFVYDTEEENRIHRRGEDDTLPKHALAKFLADLGVLG